MHFLRQAPDVVMRLDHLRRIAADGNAFDHVRIKRPLREKLVAAMSATGWTRRGEFVGAVLSIFREQFLSRVLKDFDELVADDFAFLLGIGHAAELGKKALGSIDILETDVKIFAEDALHDFFLARAEQSVVDENTGELIADGLV